MPFYLFKLQTADPTHAKFNGRVAIGLDWGANPDEPFTEREIIITHLSADENEYLIRTPPDTLEFHERELDRIFPLFMV